MDSLHAAHASKKIRFTFTEFFVLLPRLTFLGG